MSSEPHSPPEITVAGVIHSGGRFLIVEEIIDRQRVFNQPAGHVEPGETLLAAVVREVREETAWGFAPQELLGVYLLRHTGTVRSTLRFAFTGAVSDHDPGQPLDSAIVRTHWLSREQLQERERELRSPLVLRCIDDFLGGQRLPLEAVAGLNLSTAGATTIPAVIL